MFKLVFCVTAYILFTVVAEDITEKVDLLDHGTYTWNGLNMENTAVNVTAEGFYISVTIETCDIGREVTDVSTNKEYLILREGNDDSISKDIGRRFAYVKTSKKLYFYSSSVILELKAPKALTKPCRVKFEKADEEATTLPPVTTTQETTSVGPNVSKYSTVFISGRNIEDFNSDTSLLLQLKVMLANMAADYAKVEGFCLLEDITTKNVEMKVLEECSIKWLNYRTCIRVVYAIPVKLNEKCPLEKGYQLNKQHLDIMWNRMAEEYLTDGFSVYMEPSIANATTWWIVFTVTVAIGFSILMMLINILWKKWEIKKSQISSDSDDYMPDLRRDSVESMTPTDYQSIPPMFEGTHSNGRTYFGDQDGADNEGFQC